MGQVIATYGTPSDKRAFDRYYFDAALASAEGQATAADQRNLATVGVKIYFAETVTVS